jgi:hypothetical protein
MEPEDGCVACQVLLSIDGAAWEGVSFIAEDLQETAGKDHQPKGEDGDETPSGEKNWR